MTCRASTAMRAWATLALLLHGLLLAAALPAWYNCPATCTGECRCASTAPPGGLPREQVPQLVLLTHDDGANALSCKNILSVTANITNPNGCNIPATFYTLPASSDCATVRRLYVDNHEIATHTMTHSQLVPGYDKMAWDVTAARDWVVACGVPKEHVVGFRSPYLVHNPQLRAVLRAGGFLYDSSIDELFPSDTSTGPAERLFPYSMDYGVPQNCNWTAPYGLCTPTERWPGLWEIPMMELQAANGDSLSTMDPVAASADALLQQMVSNLLFSYNGNRAPMGIYTHSPWFTPEHTEALQRFIAYARALPDVWFVTARQAVEWMQAPVPASQMGGFVKCRPVNSTSSEDTAPCRIYTIQAGDFLYNISSAVGTSMADLMAANPELNSTKPLQPGQVIKLPPWTANCQLPRLPSPTSGFSAAAASGAFASPAPAPAELLRADFVLSGCNATGFVASKQAMFVNGLAALAGLGPPQVAVLAVADWAGPRPRATSSARRLLQAEASLVSVATQIASPNATATANLLFGALQLGSLSSALAIMGLSLSQLNMSVPSQAASPSPTTTSVSPDPTNSSPVPGAAIPSPSLSPSAAASSPAPSGALGVSGGVAGSDSRLGLILGASLGGGVGGLLLLGGAAYLYFVVRRSRRGGLRRDLWGTGDGLRAQYTLPTTMQPVLGTLGIPTVTLHTSIPKDQAAVASTPRSARARNPTPFSQ